MVENKKTTVAHSAILSFKDLAKNLNLLIPDILLLILSSVLVLVFVKFNNLAPIFSKITSPQLFYDSIASHLSLQSNLIKFVFSTIGLILLNFGFGLSFITTRYLMITSIINQKKPTFWNTYKSCGRYIFKVFTIKLCLFLIYITPALIALLFIFLFKINLLRFIFILALIILYIFFFFALSFVWPVLFLNTRGNVFKSIKITFKWFKLNRKKVAASVLIIIFVKLILSYAISRIDLLLKNFINQNYALLIGGIQSLIGVFLVVWASMFLFNVYKTSKH